MDLIRLIFRVRYQLIYASGVVRKQNTFSAVRGEYWRIYRLNSFYYSKESMAVTLSSLGFSKSKLVLGIPFYGRGWLLEDVESTALGAPAVSRVYLGNHTREPGIWAFYEICQKITDEKGTNKFDGTIQASYAYTNVWWIGYNDEQTVRMKVNCCALPLNTFSFQQDGSLSFYVLTGVFSDKVGVGQQLWWRVCEGHLGGWLTECLWTGSQSATDCNEECRIDSSILGTGWP